MVDTSSTSAPTPTVNLSQIDQTSRGEGQGLETASHLYYFTLYDFQIGEGADIRHQSPEASPLELHHLYLPGY
jgi:hypothetical protein